MAIVVNKPIPEFDANATGGLKVSNTSHLGHVLVMYFYPKDNTPGCTTEAMQFRDRYKDFEKAGATVYVKFPGHPTEKYQDIWDFILQELSAPPR